MGTSSNYPRSVQISVNLKTLRQNYERCRELAGSKAFAVIKADAYGHGADAVASYLSPIADGFAVVTVGEGVAVRDAGIAQPIMVMQGPQDDADINAIYEHGLWPCLHDEAQIEKVLNHGRLGLSLEQAARQLESDQLRWQGVMSHLASADEPSNPKTSDQAERFRTLIADRDLPLSLANSAGVLAWPDTKRDWARVGIALYGSHPVDSAHADADGLAPVMTVTAPVISVKRYPAGSTIGYAETFVCPEPMTIAYVAIGYADGLPRVLDDTADVAIDGVRCPIIGRVSMDSIAVDCRGLAAAPMLGDSAIIWGPDHPVDRLAAAAGTISYELLTGIQGRRTFTE